MKTGYYVQTRQPYYRSKVHIIDAGKPYCGSFIHKDSEFQGVCWGVALNIIECEKCKAKWLKEGKSQ